MSLILITGSTGFVGSHVLKKLQENGHKLRLVIREGTQSRVADMRGVEKIVYTPDLFLESSNWWAEACSGVDTVIHLAWYAEPGKYLQSDKNLQCLVGTINLARGAIKANVKRFVGIGTCFEYEMSNKPLSIHDRLNPLSLYAATKTSAYLTLSQCFKQKGLSFVWCRLFYIFGEGEDPRRFIPYLHSQLSSGEVALLTSGAQIRDFINVSSAALQIVESTFNSSIVGAVNICSGEPISIRHLAENIADQYNARSLLRFGARPDNIFDPFYVVGIRGT